MCKIRTPQVQWLEVKSISWGFHICHCAQPPCFPIIKLPTPPGSLINTSKQCVKLNSVLSYSLQNLLGASVPLEFPSPTPSTSSITGAGHYENVPQIQSPSLYNFSPKLHLFSKFNYMITIVIIIDRLPVANTALQMIFLIIKYDHILLKYTLIYFPLFTRLKLKL